MQGADVIDAVEDAVAVTDANLRVVAWNAAMERLTGCRRGDALGRSVLELLPAVDAGEARAALRRALAAETVTLDERCADAGARPACWLAARFAPWRDGDGAVAGAVAFLTDVTERRQRALSLSAIDAVGQSLTSSLDLDHVLDTIVGKTLEVMGAQTSMVVGWEPQTDWYTVLRAAGRVGKEFAAAGPLRFARGPCARAVHERRIVTSANALADPEMSFEPELRELLARGGLRAAAAAPLVAKGRVLGALGVFWDTERTVSDGEVMALRLLAEQAALAIDNARLYADATRRAERLRRIAETEQLITGSLDVADVMLRLAHVAASMHPGAYAAVRVYDPDRRELEMTAASSHELNELPVVLHAPAGLAGIVVERQAPVIVAEPADHPRTIAREWWRARPDASFYGVPIVVADALVGVLTYVRPHGVPDAEEQEALRLLAAQAGVAIRNAGRYQTERYQTERIRALAKVNQRISRALELDELLRAIAEAAVTLSGVTFASFWLADEDRETMTLSGGSKPEIEADFPARAVSYDAGLVGWVARHRVPLIVEDVFLDDRVVHLEWWRRWNLRAFRGYPVMAGDELLAVLALNHSTPMAHSPTAWEVVEMFIAQASIAIQNARLFREAQRRRDTAEALVRLSQELTSTLAVERIAEIVVRGVTDLVHVKVCALYRYRPEDGSLRVMASSGVDVRRAAHVVLGPDEGLAGRAVFERRIFSSADVLADARIKLSPALRQWVEESGYRAGAAVPLVTPDRVIGALTVGVSPERALDAEELQTLQVFADRAALALENARLYEESERERRDAAALALAARRLALRLDVDEVTTQLADTVVQVLRAQGSAVFRRNDNGTLTAVAFGGRGAHKLPRGQVLPADSSIVASTVDQRQPMWSRDALGDERRLLTPELRALVESSGNRAILVVPLVVEREAIGALAVGYRTPRDFEPREIALLQAFADQAALALENARLYARTRDSLRQVREAQSQLVQAGKLSALGQLVSGVAHELNNPLSVIVGYAQLILMREIPEELRRSIEIMLGQADRMAKIVRNLLLFARQRPPERARLDLNEVIEETLALRLNALSVAGIAVERQFADALPAVAGDTQQLQQVFLNLILNAEQAILQSGQGGRIVFRTCAAPGGRVRAQVVDDGPGIAPAHLPRVFEPFFTTKPVGTGTGLGLSVSYGIVEQHGGTLAVESRPGLTTFTVELPAAPAGAPGSGATAVAPAGRTRGRSALIIEDEPNVGDFIATILGAAGWDVDIAAGGHDALARTRTHRYDLVVCDARMPDGSGQEFYVAATRDDPTLCGRFLVVTADSANGAACRFFKDAGVPIVEKPISPARLRDTVDALVGASRLA